MKMVDISTNRIALAITTVKFMKYKVEYQVKTDTKWWAYIWRSKPDVPRMITPIKKLSTMNQAQVCYSAQI
jgi:hypothetical protein